MSRVWTLHHYNPGKLKVSDGRTTALDPAPIDLTLATWHMPSPPQGCTSQLHVSPRKHHHVMAIPSDPRSPPHISPSAVA